MIFSATILASIDTHNILQDSKGYTYCDCKAWRFSRLPPKERECKHIAAYNLLLEKGHIVPGTGQEFFAGQRIEVRDEIDMAVELALEKLK